MNKILFLHPKFPGQFLHLVRHMVNMPGMEVHAVGSEEAQEMAGVTIHKYQFQRDTQGHPYLTTTDIAVWRGQLALATCLKLYRTGWKPDIIIGHNGWGELLYLKDLWPQTPVVGYFEFFYRSNGADVGFDPIIPVTLDQKARLRTMNAVNLLGLDAVDLGVCPTSWQRALHPIDTQHKLKLLHDGIDTDVAAPAQAHPLLLPSGERINPGTPLITYVARDLEPYRGFHKLMEAAPIILKQNPTARIVIAGGDGVSYGRPAPEGTWREWMMRQVGDALPKDRLHFTGPLPYPEFINLIRLSSIHIYLTFPFVLSWSMLEAMSTGALLVASRTAPVEEVVIHENNGLLVPFHDPANLADTVTRALRLPPSRREAISMAARSTVVQKYDAQRVAVPAWLDCLRSQFGLQ